MSASDVQPPAESIPNPESATEPSVAAPPARLKLWLPVVVMALYWAVIYYVYTQSLGMFERFITRFIAFLISSLILIGWWFWSSRFTLKTRWLVFGSGWLATGIVLLAGHSSMNPITQWFGGLPPLLTLGTLWLLLTASQTPRVQALGLYTIVALTFGSFLLTRWDGLDGRQQSQISWRWTPTPEERFLSEVSQRGTPEKVVTAAPAGWKLQPGDWPAFRGPDRNDEVAGNVLPADSVTPKVIWKQAIGPGWSSVIVVDGHLVTQEQRGPDEVVACYDAETGKEVWLHQDPLRFEEALSGPGPRGTPAFANGRIVTLGARLQLTCLKAETGKLLWQHDLISETKAAVPQWGASVSPLIVGDLVVIYSGGKESQNLQAYQLKDGKLAWSSAVGTSTYSSPQLCTLFGKPQIVIHDDQGVWGVDPKSGKSLWHQPTQSAAFVPMLQPHVIGECDLLVGWDNGIARLAIKQEGEKWNVSERWNSDRMKAGFNDFHLLDGYAYGFDDGILCCVDIENGQRKWKKGRYGFGQIILAPEQQRLIVLTEQGDVAVVAANPERFEELGRTPVLTGKTWNHAVLAHQRLYVRNGEEMACLGFE